MNIVLRKTSDLAIHPSLKGLPELPGDHPQFVALLESIEAEGEILQPLIIDDEDQVMDGRHRLRGAKLKHIAEVPCIVKAAGDCVSIVLETLMARRHYTKGALAYLALPLLPAAIAESSSRKLANLKQGGRKASKSPDGVLNTPSGKKSPVDALAERIGVSSESLDQARKVAKLFAAQEEVISAWLQRNEAQDAWAACDQERAGAWTAFAENWIREHGLDPQLDTKADFFPPENFRERWEPELFEGNIGLGGIIQAVAGLTSTKGQPRGDKAEGEDAAFKAVLVRIEKFTLEGFERWNDITPERRVPLLQTVSVAATKWPEDVRRTVLTALKAHAAQG